MAGGLDGHRANRLPRPLGDDELGNVLVDTVSGQVARRQHGPYGIQISRGRVL